jgi:hypothetical protein
VISLLGRDIGKWIKSYKPLRVCDIEIADVVNPAAGDAIGDCFGKIAVRIDDAEAVSRQYVEHGEIEKEGGFAGAGFADDVDVAGALLGCERDRVATRCSGGNVKWLRLHKLRLDKPGQSPVRYLVRSTWYLAVSRHPTCGDRMARLIGLLCGFAEAVRRLNESTG